MKKIDWDKFVSDDKALEYLKGLPRYKNTAIKSAFSRVVFFLKLLYCRTLRIDKPLFIVLVTNNACNLNCRYCYGGYGSRDDRNDYSTKELLKIIDKLKTSGTQILTVHGGESLLRNDIGEVINYAKLRGFYISLNTNGYLVPLKIKELKCLDAIVVSLDGSEENNDKNRGKGSYRRALEAIDVIAKNSIPLVISATLTKNSFGDIEALGILAKQKKSMIQYSILYNEKDLKGAFDDIIIDREEIRKTVQKIWDAKKKGCPVYYSDNVLRAAISWSILHDDKEYFMVEGRGSSKRDDLIPCYHGKLKYQIDADGRVITCWAHNNPDAPNIKEMGVSVAIKKCHDDNKCKYCTFLANNEHNALMHLGLGNILNILYIHLVQILKIKSKL